MTPSRLRAQTILGQAIQPASLLYFCATRAGMTRRYFRVIIARVLQSSFAAFRGTHLAKTHLGFQKLYKATVEQDHLRQPVICCSIPYCPKQPASALSAWSSRHREQCLSSAQQRPTHKSNRGCRKLVRMPRKCLPREPIVEATGGECLRMSRASRHHQPPAR